MLPKVLIVDDEPSIRSAFRRLLRRQFEVLEAGDAQAALEAVARHQPRVAVVDYNLPGVKGDELLRQLRLRHPDVHRILLSGAPPAHVEDLVAEGLAERFYAKPWSAPEMIAFLESCAAE